METKLLKKFEELEDQISETKTKEESLALFVAFQKFEVELIRALEKNNNSLISELIIIKNCWKYMTN